MKTLRVSQLMIPIAEYAAVYEDATLYEAVAALQEARKRAEASRDKHRSLIVFNREGQVVGHLTQWDVCRGLEPKYKHIGNLKQTSRYGFSPDFIRSMVEAYGLWRRPLDDICKRAADMKLSEIMNAPGEGECVEENATLDEAIHQLVMGHHHCLLVTRGKEIVGLLRLSDVFDEISGRVQSCRD